MTNTVLLTGASSGLGLAIARLLCRGVDRLILTARESSLPRLEAAGIQASERVRLRALDVTQSSQRRAVVAEAEADWGGVDVLINNAAVTYRAVVEHVNEAERLAQMDVNFLSPMHLMRLVLPGMRAKRAGRIINISSVGGMMAMPTMSIYSASKFALEGVSEALWYEVRPWGIKVTLVEPGFIHSRSFANTRYTVDGQDSMLHADDPYHAHYENMAPFIARTMMRSWATPESVARKVVRVMRAKRPPLRVGATLDAPMFSLFRRLTPQRLYNALLFRMLPNVRRWGPPSPDHS
ncbi:MAG: SDR family NAD(P)-dependent oxidoreductase [Planctomycetes bacterium]|nr:SDR family NAD(P)-dependent oxidoreductase [Planctomycetota bacterium]